LPYRSPLGDSAVASLHGGVPTHNGGPPQADCCGPALRAAIAAEDMAATVTIERRRRWRGRSFERGVGGSSGLSPRSPIRPGAKPHAYDDDAIPSSDSRRTSPPGRGRSGSADLSTFSDAVCDRIIRSGLSALFPLYLIGLTNKSGCLNPSAKLK
jgi:hypothetical protein